MEAAWSDFVPLWLRISVSVFLLALISLYIYSYKKHRYFKDLSIQGPKPTFLVGSLLQTIQKGFLDTDIEWMATYGKVYGVYFGVLPTLFISEPEMIREVFVENFVHFNNRIEFVSSEMFDSFISNAKDDHWKFLRSQLTPAYSSGKLKTMTPVIQTCVDKLIVNITDKTFGNKAADMREIFGAYTMDVIASTGFGIEIDSQKNPDDPFVKNAKEAMTTGITSLLLLISLIFPSTKGLIRWMGFDFFPKHTVKFFETVTQKTISDRKKDQSTCHRDILQRMLNTCNAEGEEQSGDYNQYKTRGLSDSEVISNAFLFFVVAYDTTSNALAFTAYLLATNQDCQEKLIKEIDSSLGKEKPTYDTIFSLRYLDMVFSEVLRMYPPANRLNRQADKSVVINGYTIPKGTGIVVPVFALHRCADYWPDPETFDPERFTPENKAKRHPCVYLPFGTGPRNCLGMRLALLEAKMAIVSILQRFRFKTSPETEIPPKLEKHDGVTRAENGLLLRIEPRDQENVI